MGNLLMFVYCHLCLDILISRNIIVLILNLWTGNRSITIEDERLSPATESSVTESSISASVQLTPTKSSSSSGNPSMLKAIIPSAIIPRKKIPLADIIKIKEDEEQLMKWM